MLFNRKIAALILFHIVAILVARFFFSFNSGPPLAIQLVPFFGLLIAQSAMLGSLPLLAETKVDRALGQMAVGSFFLWTVLTLEVWGAFPAEAHLFAIAVIAVPMLAVFFVVLAVRKRGACLQVVDFESPQPDEGLKFSIRHIMVLTMVVAALITLGKGVRMLYGELQFHDQLVGGYIFVVIFALFYLVQVLVNIWACLGSSRPPPRIVLAGLLTVGLITVCLYYFPFNEMGRAAFIGSVIIQQVVVTGSLLALRWWRYRLIVPTKPEEASTEL